MFPALFEPSSLLTPLEQRIQQQACCLALHQTRMKLGKGREVKAGIAQLQTQQVFPIKTAAHRFGGLPVGESFKIL